LKNLLISAAILLLIVSNSSYPQEDKKINKSAFEIAGEKVQVANSYFGEIKIPSGDDQIETFIPISVHHGIYDGPTVAMIAGIHGSEYSPILSMQKLTDFIDPSMLSGTLIIVHIANLPAFTSRTIYFSPNDLKNLNRSFPGNINGTVTERIAHIITKEVIKQSDYVIDIHSGDGNESLRPSYAAYYAEAGEEEVIKESKRIAVAFGLETIIQFSGSYASVDDAIYTSAQAVTLGIPAMDVESGELGIIDDHYIDPITDGALNVMRELGMITGDPKLPNNPIFINDRSRVYSNHDGIFYPNPLVKTGDYVSTGTRLGMITDYHGNKLEAINAPSSGLLLILFGTPPVNEGDNIVVIGKIDNK